MKGPALVFALVAAASIVGIASYSNSHAPGADIRIVKTDPFVKDQSRLCEEGAPPVAGCETPGEE